jgi:serine/threonine protein kinase
MTDERGECPSLSSLEEHVVGGATGEEIRLHLAACASCRTAAEEIAANNAILEKITRLGLDREASIGAGDTALGCDAVRGYEILREVHRGAQGVVYRAQQLTTRRTVALKVLLRGAFATSRQRLRFEREIDLVAGLSHPNIVTVYDSGRTADGRHWFAMEYVDGEALDRFVAARRLPLRELLRLFGSICGAVTHAHQRGVIHRDLKPANVLVDREGSPRVVDFGLAKALGPVMSQEQATVTVEGGFLGTLAYAAPEQTRGDHGEVDVRSDVYSLGVILYEMLAGDYPYPVTGHLSDVLDAIANVPPRPLRGWHGGPYRLDGELETIVLKALAKEPQRRYQSAEALRRDVEHYLAGEPIDAKRDSGWYVLRKTLRRYKLQVAAGVVLLVLLSGFSVAMSVAWRRSELAYQRAETERQKLAHVNVFLEDTLGSVEPTTEQGEVTVREMLDEGVHWIDLVLGDLPEVEAAVRTVIGNGYRNIGLYEEAEEQHRRALRIREQRLGAEHLDVTKSLTSLGLVRRDQGRLAEARELFQRALEIRMERLGPEDLDVAMARTNLAEIEWRMGRLEEARRLMSEVLDVRRRVLGPAHADVAMSEFTLARLLEQMGRLDEALELHRRALAIRLDGSVMHEEHPDVARSLLALSDLQVRRGDPQAALPLLEECRRLRESLGEGDRRRIEVEIRLGQCLALLGRSGDARHLLEAALRSCVDPRLREAAERALREIGDTAAGSDGAGDTAAGHGPGAEAPRPRRPDDGEP